MLPLQDYKFPLIGIALVKLGTEINLRFCNYQQFTGLLTDNYKLGNYVFSLGDFIICAGYASAIYWAFRFLFRRELSGRRTKTS